jgi:hypothetical protein
MCLIERRVVLAGRRRMAAHPLLVMCLVLLPLAATSGATGRAVSMRVLQERLEECDRAGAAPDDLETLCGLTSVLGYVVDKDQRDLILVGRVDHGDPPLHLQDLVVALRNARADYAELRGGVYFYTHPGCTIDPDPEVLLRLREASAGINIATSEAETALGILDWYSECRAPQSVTVFGVPHNTHFAKIMVDADYGMKRIVDGSDSLDIRGFKSLTDATLAEIRRGADAEGDPKLPGSSMNRFWFYPDEVLYRENDGVKLIEVCSVQLLTEEQRVLSTGETMGTGRVDILAAEFARSFTAHYDEIAAKRPVYHELQRLFVFVALSKLMEREGLLEGWPVSLRYLLEEYEVPPTHVDSTVIGHANVKALVLREYYSGGYADSKTWLPTCGGVSMQFDERLVVSQHRNADELTELRQATILERPRPNAVSWEFAGP